MVCVKVHGQAGEIAGAGAVAGAGAGAGAGASSCNHLFWAPVCPAPPLSCMAGVEVPEELGVSPSTSIVIDHVLSSLAAEAVISAR